MTSHCIECNSEIDTAHDEYYQCQIHREIIRCERCYREARTCPECDKTLSYNEASLTKRLFEPGPHRDLLGF